MDDNTLDTHMDNLALVNTGFSEVKEIAMGAFPDITCAISDTGAAKCWGLNQYGILGQGVTTINTGYEIAIDDRTGIQKIGAVHPQEVHDLSAIDLGTNRTVKQIAVSGYNACAILDNDKVKCWGRRSIDENGKADYGLVIGDEHLGDGDADGNSDMGDSLPYINLGEHRTAKQITAGIGHVCALLDDDQVKCWGQNSVGQLGVGDTEARITEEEMDDLQPIDFGENRSVLAVEAMGNSNCAILDNLQIKCWGNNHAGQLGLGHTDNIGDNLTENGESEIVASPVVDLGEGRLVTQLAGGPAHMCALLNNEQVKCWGHNDEGVLGVGLPATDNGLVYLGTKPEHMGDNLREVNLGVGRTVKQIETSPITYARHACALLDNDEVKCWGYNRSGQLGLDDQATRGMSLSNMGDALPAVNL